ncbi:MAG: SDR family NAD(P)-dependent oxidoreductase [Taibaiella sp.]|jgi:uncharacterized oxidoreductase
MNTSNNTVLITGGSAGIGFAIAKLLSEKGNHVIITGRNQERLNAAAAQLGNVTAIACDVTNEEDVRTLATRIELEFPQLNVLINNAGEAYVHQLNDHNGSTEKAIREMNTNFFSILNLNEKLLPLLSHQAKAAIVNVSSIVAFVPGHTIPTYSASKAALHSYTLSLRYALAHSTGIEVYELMPPLVNTAFSKDIGGENGIDPVVVANDLLHAFEQKQFEIHVGGTADLFNLYLSAPDKAFEVMNPAKLLA